MLDHNYRFSEPALAWAALWDGDPNVICDVVPYKDQLPPHLQHIRVRIVPVPVRKRGRKT